MIWDKEQQETRSLIIPKGDLAGDETLLEFQLVDAAAPADLKVGAGSSHPAEHGED